MPCRFDTRTPIALAYGFRSQRVFPQIPEELQISKRRVIAKKGWTRNSNAQRAMGRGVCALRFEREQDMQDRTSPRNIKSLAKDLPGQVVLVLQGGGALGSYQAGVYQALHEAGIEPDWIIGT